MATQYGKFDSLSRLHSCKETRLSTHSEDIQTSFNLESVTNANTTNHFQLKKSLTDLLTMDLCSNCVQEDAAIGNVGFDDKKALFGVFDGHGGSEVAKYTKKYLEDIIRDTNEYKDRDYCQSMRRSFLRIDERLKEDGCSELGQMKKD